MGTSGVHVPGGGLSSGGKKQWARLCATGPDVPFRWDKKRGEREEEEREKKEETTHVSKKGEEKRERDLYGEKIVRWTWSGFLPTPINYNFLFNLCETRFIKLVPRSMVTFMGRNRRKIYLPSIFPPSDFTASFPLRMLSVQSRFPQNRRKHDTFNYAQILFSRHIVVIHNS